MSYNAIRENKILAKISESTVLATKCYLHCHCSVSTGYAQKAYLSGFRAWILTLETAFLSRENTSTG